MIQADDRVLVGVINRKRDLNYLLNERWYRIPQGRAPKGIQAEWLAFFLSGKVFKERSGGIHYFARNRGHELVRRRDLLPNETRRADDLYHKIQLDIIQEKIPPIWNKPEPYRFAFIYTTGDRFQSARHIRDLYSDADYFVDRVFHVLKQQGYKPRRHWQAAEEFTYPLPQAQLTILCESGEVNAVTGDSDDKSEEFLYMKPSRYLQDVQQNAQRIIEEINRRGGPRMVDIPIDLY